MKTLTEKQIAQAKKFIKEHNVPAIYVKTENGHMYSEQSNALASVGKSDLEEAIKAGVIAVVEPEKESDNKKAAAEAEKKAKAEAAAKEAEEKKAAAEAEKKAKAEAAAAKAAEKKAAQ